MKKAWILWLIAICSVMLLGERVSTNPASKTSSATFFHATTDHSDSLLAIELEDEAEDDGLSFFCLAATFVWKLKQLFFILFIVLLLYSQHVQEKSPAYLRFHNLRL